jgi:hypothetical protein
MDGESASVVESVNEYEWDRGKPYMSNSAGRSLSCMSASRNILDKST